MHSDRILIAIWSNSKNLTKEEACLVSIEIKRYYMIKLMKSALLAVAWNSDSWTFDALENHYKTLVRYLNLKDQGMILGRGCVTPGMTARSISMSKAYQLGKSLR